MRTVPLNITMSATTTNTSNLPQSLSFSPNVEKTATTEGMTVAEGCVITFIPMGVLNDYIADPSFEVIFTWNGASVILSTTTINPTNILTENSSYTLEVKPVVTGGIVVDDDTNITTRTGHIIL